MDNRAIKLLEEKINLVKKLILNSNEISEENKYKRISELEELEIEIKQQKTNMNFSKDPNMIDINDNANADSDVNVEVETVAEVEVEADTDTVANLYADAVVDTHANAI